VTKEKAKECKNSGTNFKCTLVEGLECKSPEAKKMELIHFEKKINRKNKGRRKRKKKIQQTLSLPMSFQNPVRIGLENVLNRGGISIKKENGSTELFLSMMKRKICIK